MKTKILAFTLVMTTFASTAFAEQPKATEYRNIMSSGTYYIEYEMNTVKKALAVQDQKRMDYTTIKSGPNTALAALGFINPLFALAGLFSGGDKKNPSALYQDGKYYQFEGKKKATMVWYNQLNDENLDPSMGWSNVQQKLSLPHELVTFSPNDIFNSFSGYTAPRFIESGKKTIDKDEYNYDKYSIIYNNRSGNVLYKKNFYLYYDLEKGELHHIDTFTRIGANGKEVPSGTLTNIVITGELPEKALEIPEGCKVYAAGTGDINDLLQKPVLVENYSKKDAEAGDEK